MKYYLVIFSAAISLSACSTSKKTVATVPNKPASVIASTNEPDGSSYAKAIIIDAKGEIEGIRAEHAWLKKNYPGYKMVQQSSGSNNKKQYDTMKFTAADGKVVTIYFDITNFFGKF
jgi:major membrane immunogen (membrane-anchored lipoprotein)